MGDWLILRVATSLIYVHMKILLPLLCALISSRLSLSASLLFTVSHVSDEMIRINRRHILVPGIRGDSLVSLSLSLCLLYLRDTESAGGQDGEGMRFLVKCTRRFPMCGQIFLAPFKGRVNSHIRTHLHTQLKVDCTEEAGGGGGGVRRRE